MAGRDHAAEPAPAQARRVSAPERAGGGPAGSRTHRTLPVHDRVETDPDVRRRALVGLNKAEAHHALKRVAPVLLCRLHGRSRCGQSMPFTARAATSPARRPSRINSSRMARSRRPLGRVTSTAASTRWTVWASRTWGFGSANLSSRPCGRGPGRGLHRAATVFSGDQVLERTGSDRPARKWPCADITIRVIGWDRTACGSVLWSSALPLHNPVGSALHGKPSQKIRRNSCDDNRRRIVSCTQRDTSIQSN